MRVGHVRRLRRAEMLVDRSLTLTGGDVWNVLTGPDERRWRSDALFALVREGRLAARIDASLPMRDGAEARRLLESRGTIGKVLLLVE